MEQFEKFEGLTEPTQVLAHKVEEKPIEDTEIEIVNTDEIEDTDEDFIIKLSKKYSFEGKEFTELNLNGLRSLGRNDLTKAEYRMARLGLPLVNKEFDSTFALILARYSTGLPIEFFDILNIKDITAISVLVRSFLLSSV